jgi:uncharacterized protein
MKKINKQFLFVKYWVILVLSFGINFNSFSQDALPDKPKEETSVYDKAHLLTDAQKIQLKQKLINYADTTSTQIVVVTIKSLEGHNINLYAAEWAHKWGIGQEGKDNGLLFLIAKEDRKMSIQVGYGLEHLLTDAISRRIIELVIAPHFKEGNYYAGIDAGTTSMMEVLSGEYVNDVSADSFPVFWIVFISFIIIILFIVFSEGKSGGNYTSSGPIVLDGGGRSGGFTTGGFSGGSGGSFGGGGGFSGGFGGGGFGGGGASGGW